MIFKESDCIIKNRVSKKGNSPFKKWVEVTHIPTGIWGVCAEYKSSIKNKEECLSKLKKIVEERS